MPSTEEWVRLVESAPDADTARARYRAELFPRSMERLTGAVHGARVLVLTVGAQPYSVALSLAATPAPVVIAIHTVESEASVDQALELLPERLRPPTLRRRIVDSADSTAVYQAVVEAAKGHVPADVVIDFTSGTKAMTAGASTVAGYLRLRQVYISSRQLQGAGKGLFSHEVLHRVDHPLVVLGDIERQAAERAFDAGDWSLAERLFEELDQARVPGWHFGARATLARSYRAWEDLRFADAAHGLEDVARLLAQASSRFLPDEPLLRAVPRLQGQAAACRTLAAATASAARPQQAPAQVAAIARWLLSASRRAARQRRDLAALLLYRALELSLQRRLATHGLDAGAFELPQGWDGGALLSSYNQLTGPRHGLAEVPEQLALAQAHTMLLVLKDAVVTDIDARIPRARLLGLVQARNRSVFAHGYRTLGDGAVQELRAVVLAYVQATVLADGQTIDPERDPDFDFVEVGVG